MHYFKYIYYVSEFSSHKFSAIARYINNKLRGEQKKKRCINNICTYIYVCSCQAVHNLKCLGFAYIIQCDNKIINNKRNNTYRDFSENLYNRGEKKCLDMSFCEVEYINFLTFSCYIYCHVL